MNKRIAKKRGAGRNFWMDVETPDGPVVAHVNRRRCKKPLTAKDQEALAAIIAAATRQIREAEKARATSSGFAVGTQGERP